jgi:hypothetical protein
MAGENAFDMVGDRLDLAFGFTRAEDQIIGDRSKLGDVEDEDVFGLFFKGRLGDGNRFGLRLRYDRIPPDTSQSGLYRIRQGQATGLRALRAL